MLLTRLSAARRLTRKRDIANEVTFGPLSSCQKSSFHTSASVQKMVCTAKASLLMSQSPKQKKMMMNNAAFVGMEKARAIEEQRLKQGDTVKSSTRMLIKVNWVVNPY